MTTDLKCYLSNSQKFYNSLVNLLYYFFWDNYLTSQFSHPQHLDPTFLFHWENKNNQRELPSSLTSNLPTFLLRSCVLCLPYWKMFPSLCSTWMLNWITTCPCEDLVLPSNCLFPASSIFSLSIKSFLAAYEHSVTCYVISQYQWHLL